MLFLHYMWFYECQLLLILLFQVCVMLQINEQHYFMTMLVLSYYFIPKLLLN